MKVGFFSEKAVEFGTVIYKRPDGTEVEITGIYGSQEEGEREYGWADKVCVGEVTEFVREGRPYRHEKKNHVYESSPKVLFKVPVKFGKRDV